MDNDKSGLGSTELAEGHFEQDNIANEEAFKSSFEAPMPFNEMQEMTMDDDADKGDADKGDGADGGDDGEATDFKFDDALAQEEKAELDELNAKLGTDFETRQELEAMLKKQSSGEQASKIDEDKRYIGYFQDLLNEAKYPDEELVREDKRIMAINNGQNVKDQSIIDAIEYEVTQLTESGALSYAAKSIRDNLNMSLREKLKTVNDFNESQKLSATQKADKAKQDLQSSINSVFKKGKFMGIQPTKDDMIDIYKDISKDKHIEHLKAHPTDAVEFALFKKYREVISKSLGKPNFEAGVKNTLKELGMSNSSQTDTSGKDIAKDSDAGDLSFLQRFAK